MQTSYGDAPRAYCGLVADSFLHEYLSRALATRQLEELTFGTTDGTYTVTINGVEVASFVAASATATAIRDAIYDDIAASAAPVTLEKSGTDKLLIEGSSFAGDAGFTIAISTVAGYSIAHLVAQGQSVPFGVGLVKDERGPSGTQCRLPRATTDISAGFLGIAAADSGKQFNPAGWVSGELPRLLHRGHIWCWAEGAIAELAPIFCRFAAGAGGTQLGAFRGDADTATATAVPGMRALVAKPDTGLGICLVEYNPQT